MGYVLGVDLGTTFTAAAVRRDDKVEIVTMGSSGGVIPSIVFLGVDGTILVGESARRHALSEPGRVVREFKRRFGDPTPLLVGGTPVSADVLTGRLLGAVVDLVAQREGGRPDLVAVTHPATWGPYKIDLLRNACRVAGVDEVVFVPEPVAAATQYAAADGMATGATVAVYDLGGGTFDAAVLRHDVDGFTILGHPEGIERIGGIDFDAAIVGYVDESLGGALAALDLDDPDAAGAAARVQRECVEAKEALSEDTSASVGVYLPGRTEQVRITRDELEQRIRPALQETVAGLRRALASANVTADEVDSVLLVGGSSRIPLVAELVGAELRRPVSVDAHPKHTVAMGAARFADTARSVHPSTPAPSAPQPAEPSSAGVAFVPAERQAPAPHVLAPSPSPEVEAESPATASLTPRPPRGVRMRGRRKILAAVAVSALLVAAVAVVAVVTSTGDETDNTAETVNVQLVAFTADRDGDGACNVAWELSGDLDSGDRLRLFWRGAAIAEGAAVATGEATSATGFDEMQLIRDGESVQAWQPSGTGC